MKTHYERLSYLDRSFLALESRTTHMHVAGIAVFDAGPLRRADGGIDIDRIRAFIESKLHLVPRYRQRLAYVPFERHPVWVDDEHFQIDYHVRHSSLPKPGSFDQLTELTARLVSQQLDRSKPLWELSVIEGLEGDRFAFVTKIHHSMIDGISGAELLAILLNLTPVEDIADPEPWQARPVPSGTEFLVRESMRRVGQVMENARSVRSFRDNARLLAFQTARRARAVAYSLGSGWLSQAMKAPLNGKVGPNRRYATMVSDLAEVKEVKNLLGGTVNDVVLATVAGGVRKYLLELDRLESDGADFRVMAPVSIRAPGQAGTLGNHVAMWLASMPIHEPDPIVRFDAVHAETDKLKQTDQALGAATLVRLSAGAPTTLVALASRLAAGARPFNMTVTNVPGPQFPMYLLGAELIDQYPLVPLWEGHGVGIALFSYNGRIDWGFNADYDIMEDLDGFVAAVQASFEELFAAARRKAKAEAKAAKKAKKAKEKGAAGSSTDNGGPKRRPPLGAKTKVMPPLGTKDAQ